MPTKYQLEAVMRRVKQQHGKEAAEKTAGKLKGLPAPAEAKPPRPDEEEYIPVGLNSLLAASEKLLAVNRGLTGTDERDSLMFKRIYDVSRLMRERVRLDADQPKKHLARVAAKTRSLKHAHAFMFDPYTTGLLIGNPLSMPLEEINPMHLVEQSRRVTQMGPGGVGSDEAITSDMQNIHPSQFGFISGLEGPESSRAGVDARLAWGTKIGDDGKLYQRFRSKADGKLHWLSPGDLDGKVVGLPD